MSNLPVDVGSVYLHFDQSSGIQRRILRFFVKEMPLVPAFYVPVDVVKLIQKSMQRRKHVLDMARRQEAAAVHQRSQ